MFDLGKAPDSANKDYELNIFATNIINSYIYLTDKVNMNIPLPFTSQTTENIVRHFFYSTKLTISASSDRSSFNVIAIIEYVK